MNSKTKTDSQIITDYLLNNIFNNDKEHKYEDIQEDVKNLLGNSYTSGKLSGVMNKMISSGKCVRVSRGIYRKNLPNTVDIGSVTKNIFKKAIEDVQKEIGDVKILELPNEQFEKIKVIRELISEIQEKLDI